MVFDQDGAYSSLHTEGSYTLNIRDFKEATAQSLATAIEQAVKETQSAIFRSYPDTIAMTTKQYDMLSGRPQFMQIGDIGQEFWLYRTKYNVMELEVLDG